MSAFRSRAEMNAAIDELPPPHSTTDPSAPATPGDALRWAAERIAARLVAAGGTASANAAVAWLNVWARDLDAARATDPAPATPPEHQPARVYELPAEASDFRRERAILRWAADRLMADEPLYRTGQNERAAIAVQLRRWADELRGVLGVPLSTTPPAGTVEVVNSGPPRPPGSGYERCRWCGETIANRAGNWEHLGEPCAGSPVEPCPSCVGSDDPMSCTACSPPAGTEPASATAVDPPAGTVTP